MHRGMSYDRLEALGGIQWPCPDEEHPGLAVPARAPVGRAARGPAGAVLASSRHKPPVRGARRRVPDPAHDRAAGSSRTTRARRRTSTARRCTAASRSTSRPRTPSGCCSTEGEIVRVSSRRGSVEAPVRIDPSLRPGLAFMTFHFPDQVDIEPAHDRRHRPEVAARPSSRPRRSGSRSSRRPSARPAALVAEPATIGRQTEWTSTSLDAEPTAAERAARRRTCSARRRRLGRRRARLPAARATRARRRARGARAPAPAAAGAAGAAGAHRLDQPGRAQRLCRAADGAARRRLRRGDVLRAARVEPRPPRVVHVCEDLACRCHGSQELIAQLEERFGAEGELSDDGSATWFRSPCLGQCDRAPAAHASTLAGEHAARARARARRRAAAVLGAARGRRRPGRRPSRRCRRRATRRCGCSRASGRVDPTSLDDYRAHGGYAALRRALELGPRGRDPRAQGLEARWAAAAPRSRPASSGRPSRASPRGRTTSSATPTSPSPGTFKDRVRDRGRPVRADRGDDDRRLRDRLRARLRLPARRVPAGARMRSSARSTRRGGAASSATTCSARASRSTSRSARAPAPTSAARRRRSSTRSRATAASRATSRRSPSWSGLFGKPTVVNNVETLVNVLDVVLALGPGVRRDRAPRARPARSSSASPGTSSGPGVYEVPFGATLRELLELAGGVRRRARAAGRADGRRRRRLPAARTSSTCR